MLDSKYTSLFYSYTSPKTSGILTRSCHAAGQNPAMVVWF